MGAAFPLLPYTPALLSRPSFTPEYQAETDGRMTVAITEAEVGIVDEAIEETMRYADYEDLDPLDCPTRNGLELSVGSDNRLHAYFLCMLRTDGLVRFEAIIHHDKGELERLYALWTANQTNTLFWQ